MAKTKDKKKEAEAPPVDGDVAEGAEGEAASKKKGPPLLIIIIAAVVILLAGGGAAAYFLFLAPKHPPAAGASKDAKKDEKKKDAKKDAKADPKTVPAQSPGPNGITYVTLPDATANIQSPDGHASYMKLKLTFECADDDTTQALMDNLPRVNDMLQGFMRELRPEDLAGSAGNYQLRLEILRRVNLVLAPKKVNAVLIEEMLIT